MIKDLITKNKKIFYFFLFILVFLYFLWLNASPSFVDPDSFYHAKMADLIRQQGIIKDFPWLPFTTLNEIYIDHHLLYHLILAPLTFIIPPLIATKLAGVFFASLVILAFQWLLDKFKIKYSFIYTLILLLTHQFTFRINLAKVPALSLIVLFLFIYLLFSKKNRWSWPLFFLSFLYVWLYAGWVIMLGIAFIYWLVKNIIEYFRTSSAKSVNSKFKIAIQNSKLFLNIILGIIAGLVINPYFPINVKFYWQQTFQIGLINYKNIVGVGGEWYGLNLFDFIGHEVFVFILLAIGLICFFIYFKKQNSKTWTLFLITLIFFVLTLKSQRNVEYFVPFSLLFSSFIINDRLRLKGILFYKKKMESLLPARRIIPGILLGLVLFYLPILFLANLKGLKDSLSKNYNFNQFSGISNWFKNNTQPGEIIFHDDWDDWPVLFYHNDSNLYIVGLDPTFMYLKSSRRYWEWKNITTHRSEEAICQTVKSKFLSNYIFVKFDNQELKKNLDRDKDCQLVYQDKDGWIYQIKL